MGIMIFDTSYLIEHPDAINRLTGNLVVPAIVLKQLDGLKNSEKEDVAYRARAASNAILEAQRSGRLMITVDYNKVDMLDNNADNVILGTAAKLKETCLEVILLTTDTNMKIAAESMGIINPINNRHTIMHRIRKIIFRMPFNSVIICIPLFASLYAFALMVEHGGWMTWIGLIVVLIGIKVSLWLAPEQMRTGQVTKEQDYFLDPVYGGIPGNIYHKK